MPFTFDSYIHLQLRRGNGDEAEIWEHAGDKGTSRFNNMYAYECSIWVYIYMYLCNHKYIIYTCTCISKCVWLNSSTAILRHKRLACVTVLDEDSYICHKPFFTSFGVLYVEYDADMFYVALVGGIFFALIFTVSRPLHPSRTRFGFGSFDTHCGEAWRCSDKYHVDFYNKVL